CSDLALSSPLPRYDERKSRADIVCRECGSRADELAKRKGSVRLRLQRWAPLALIAAGLACSGSPAGAFELFGFKLFGSKEEASEDFIGQPQHYSVETEIRTEDDDL